MKTRSHITQVMQNYFDSTDTRARESAVSIESQLLNMAAVEIEDLTLRVTRETSQSLQLVPTNIDSGGVYYAGRVPDLLLTGPDQESFSSVVGSLNGSLTTLKVYDDTLPVPTRVELDSSSTVSISPLMFTMVGAGDSQAQQYTVQYATPGALPIPNRITFWLDQLGLNQPFIAITIHGETAPQPPWISERRKSTETVSILQGGIAYSRNRWAQIDKIAVRGLPLNATLQAWSMPFSLPASPDSSRPYTTAEDRDVLYQRYWQISTSENLLREMYMAQGFTGLETIKSYSLNDSLNGVCVEPNTNGLFGISSTKLYYSDRREMLPDLTQTGLSQEPLFGLQVSEDITKVGPVRYVVLSGIPYASSSNVFQYRYTMNDTNSILPDGSLGPFNAGWRGGAPQPVSIPLLTAGNFKFVLECQDGSGILTTDIVPYVNPAFTPLASIDITALVDNPISLAFDSYGSLWIWNGAFATKVVLHYDAYIFDPDSRTIFTTDSYDSLQVA